MKNFEVSYNNTQNTAITEVFHSYEKVAHAIQIAKTIAFAMNTISYVTDRETGELLYASDDD